MAHDGQTKGLRQLPCRLHGALADAAHEDDAGLALLFAEQPQQLNAIHLRHHQIEQNESGIGRECIQECLCIRRRGALQSHCLRGVRYEFADVDFIVDDQDSLHSFHLSPACCGLIRRHEPAESAGILYSRFGIEGFHDTVDDFGELVALIGLAEEGSINQRHASLRQRLCWKSRRVDDLEIGAQVTSSLHKFHSIHSARHDDVGYQQIDFAVLRKHLKGACAVDGLEGCKAHVRQIREGHLQHVLLVVHNQYRAPPAFR